MVGGRNVQRYKSDSRRTWKRHEKTTETDRREMRGSGKRVTAGTGKKEPSHRRQPVTRDDKKLTHPNLNTGRKESQDAKRRSFFKTERNEGCNHVRGSNACR